VCQEKNNFTIPKLFLKASQLAEENNISLSAFDWSGEYLHFKLQIQIEYDTG